MAICILFIRTIERIFLVDSCECDAVVYTGNGINESNFPHTLGKVCENEKEKQKHFAIVNTYQFDVNDVASHWFSIFIQHRFISVCIRLI